MPGQQQFGHVGIGTTRHLHAGLDRRDDSGSPAVAEKVTVNRPARGCRGPRLLGRDRHDLTKLFARALLDTLKHPLCRVTAAQKINLGQEQKAVVLDHIGHAFPDLLFLWQIRRGAPDQDIGPLAGPDSRAALVGVHRSCRHLQKADHFQRRQVGLKHDKGGVQGQDIVQIAARHGLGLAVGQRAQHPFIRAKLHDDRRQPQRFGDKGGPGQKVQDRRFTRSGQPQKGDARRTFQPLDKTFGSLGRAACRKQAPVQ